MAFLIRLTLALVGLLISVQLATAAKDCPKAPKDFVRMPKTRFFFSTSTDNRVMMTYSKAEVACKKLGMRLGNIYSIEEDQAIGRWMEEYYAAKGVRGTNWWIGVKYNKESQLYEYQKGAHENEAVRYHNFIHLYNTVGGYSSKYKQYIVTAGADDREKIDYCASVAMPHSNSYGYQWSWVENHCENTRRRIMCESSQSKCNELDKEFAKEKKRYEGVFPLSNRKYVVSWEARTQKESKEFCSGLGLEILNINENQDKCLLNLIKMHRPNVTHTYFWTGWTFDVRDRIFKDNAGIDQGEAGVRIQVKGEGLKGNDNKQDFCVAFLYAFEHHNLCNCPWKYLQSVPMACELPQATICQHGTTYKKIPCVYDSIFALKEGNSVYRSVDKDNYFNAEKECRRYGLSLINADVIGYTYFENDYDKDVAYYVYSPRADQDLCELQTYEKSSKRWKASTDNCVSKHFYLCSKGLGRGQGGQGRSLAFEWNEVGDSYSIEEDKNNKDAHPRKKDYRISTIKRTFKQAKNRCTEQGMEILSTDDQNHLDYLETAAKQLNKSFWIYSKEVDEAKKYEEYDVHQHHICVSMSRHGVPKASNCKHRHYYICVSNSFSSAEFNY